MRKKIIAGCEAHGTAGKPYLTRYTLFDCRWGSVCIHVFHRSDGTDMHDHPWPYITVPLWRGYIEHTPLRRRRVRPGQVLFRPATWIHRVELIDEKPAVTLVFRGPTVRVWGFHTPYRWLDWKTYFERMGC